MLIGAIETIELKHIEVAEENVRRHSQHDGLEELADSIRLHGQMQPIVLRGTKDDPKPYQIIVGQRRYLAHEVLGKTDIKAVFSGHITDTQALLYSLAENMQRNELNYIDTSKAITDLFVSMGRNERAVQKALGISIRTIRDHISVEELGTPKAKRYLTESKISKADLKRVIQAANGVKEKIDSLLDIIGELTKYEKQNAVAYGQRHPKASVAEILKEARKPRKQETVVLNLGEDLTKAIRKATKDLSLDIESLSLTAITEWLNRNSYL
ncbi:MAG: ParB/RepB/Spo0J family partition protein [Flavobacteriales bacterium]